VAIQVQIQTESQREGWLAKLCGYSARQAVWCVLLSIYAHIAIVIGLAVYWTAWPQRPEATATNPVTLQAQWDEMPEEPLQVELTLESQAEISGLPTEIAVIDSPAFAPNAPDIPAPAAGVAPAPVLLNDNGPGMERNRVEVQTTTELNVGGGYAGRTADARGRLADSRGGTPASEHAVELGLTWLAAHQQENGGWHFRHQVSACNGRCRHPGTHQSTTAATGLALLAFLGAGQTDRVGMHQETVDRALEYLVSRQLPNRRGADFQEGTMYAQGIATVALCEAYALTGNPDLQEPAQQALNYIVNVQHPLGGWRYFPGQPGDTTVFGWQLLALQSGKLAGLKVPPKAFELAYEFLDRVESDSGASYGYQGPDSDRTPTAIGLLARMYQGWPRSDERLVRGLALLNAQKPEVHDLYFDFYASQALHHYGGPQWESWNSQLREQLVRSQETEGHEAGSWYTADPHTTAGGRLCDTALAILILEVYYRHLPIYSFRGAGDLW
jgi:hypothetical protein